MTKIAAAFDAQEDGHKVGASLGQQINETLGQAPDVVIVFASSRLECSSLLQALKTATHSKLIVGCSSAGEFTQGRYGEGSASALAICSNEMKFKLARANSLRKEGAYAAKQIVSSLTKFEGRVLPFHSLLLLTDALAGHTEEFIEQITLLTGGIYQIFGGGAGDDGKFERTYVFFDTEVYTDAAVALEILSSKPIGIGAQHGWAPKSPPYRVTAAEGRRLISLNAVPAADMMALYAQACETPLDHTNPLPFFLHNVIGIQSPAGSRLRVPLSIQPDASVVAASDIPVGAIVNMMRCEQSSPKTARLAVERALASLQGHRPLAALFLDCVATRLRLGQAFTWELESVFTSLGESVPFVGCNTYGQVAREHGQFTAFHNCTAVVCVFPE